MKKRILFIERKQSNSVSIERVFGQVAKDLVPDEFEVDFQQVPYANNFFAILQNLLWFRPSKADIYHITGHVHYMALRVPADKTVLTVHDLIFFHRRSGLRRYFLKKLFLDWPLEKVGFVTAVSEATKREIIELCAIDENKVQVIDDPMIEGFSADPIKPFDADVPVILQIGTAVNKNVVNLVKATEGLKCKLRIIGPLDDKIRAALHAAATQFENVDSVDPEGIVEEYRRSDAVAYCSVYEGFGLPIIEAQAMCKPVITSNVPPMDFVAGDAAELVDPHDVADIRRGLDRIINDVSYREELIERGRTNVKRFDSKRVAAAYTELYHEVMAAD